MDEFRKLVNFLLLMLTTLALKKQAGTDLLSYIPTISVHSASQSFHELWDDSVRSVDLKASAFAKVSYRTKLPQAVVHPIINNHCALKDYNYTLLNAQSYNDWLADHTRISLPRIDPLVQQPHKGPAIIFHRRYRITALIFAELVANGFEAAWDSATCRRLIDLLVRWGTTLAFWLTSIAGPENVYAFEQFRASSLLKRRRRPQHETPASASTYPEPEQSEASLTPSPSASSVIECSQLTTKRAPSISAKSALVSDLEQQLNRALRLQYVAPVIQDVPELDANDESLIALRLITYPEEAVQEKVPGRRTAVRTTVRTKKPLKPSQVPTSEEPASPAEVPRVEKKVDFVEVPKEKKEVTTAEAANEEKVDAPIMRAVKRRIRSVGEIVGQVLVMRELTEEEKQAQREENHRKAILIRTFLHMTVPRMPPRSDPIDLKFAYDFSKSKMEERGQSCVKLPSRALLSPPRYLIKHGIRPLIVIRQAKKAENKEHFRIVHLEMKALRLLAGCEWAARMMCYFSTSKQVQIQLRYYEPERSFRSMMEVNGGFLTFRVATFYLAELIMAIQSMQSYGLIHMDLCLDDLAISPRGDIIVQNFDTAEIYHGGCLPYWIPRHENILSRQPFGYLDYLRAAFLYHEMFSGVVLESPTGTDRRQRDQQTNRKQEPRHIDYNFMHFVSGNYPILCRDVKSITEHILFEEIDWEAIKHQIAAVPVCHKTLKELVGD